MPIKVRPATLALVVVSLLLVLQLPAVTASGPTPAPAELNPAPGGPLNAVAARYANAVDRRGLAAAAAPSAPLAGPYLTLPADFPAITVTVPANGTAAGLIFAASFLWTGSGAGSYLLILDNSGEPVYYQKMPVPATDFKLLANGSLSYYDTYTAGFIVLNSAYQATDIIQAVGSQYLPAALDLHELLWLPSNGHWVFLVNETRNIDMGQFITGGQMSAVTGQVIQELDAVKQVVWEWHSLDKLSPADSSENLLAPAIDYQHANAIAVVDNGNGSYDFLLSSRHLDEITKINRQTGDIMWRMGGRHPTISLVAGPGISAVPDFFHQHDIRWFPGNVLTLFDNHNGNNPMFSRGLEFQLDEATHTATLTRVLPANPGYYSVAMGDQQSLPNGNTLIGWGSNLTPSITEFKSDGSKAFELDFGDTNVSYRAFRFPWHGSPTWPPALVLTSANGTLNVTTSWNGATEVAAYRIYGGNSPSQLALLRQRPKTGFETTMPLSGALAQNCYYQVVPIDLAGQTMQASPVLRNLASTNAACATKITFPLIAR